MTGMNRYTGKPLSGLDHLRQSVIDILTTRVGVRVMVRGYGSDIANLIDNPTNQFLAVDIYVAVAEALTKWEPRIKLQQIIFKLLGDGRVDFYFEGIYLPDGQAVQMEGLII